MGRAFGGTCALDYAPFGAPAARRKIERG